MALSYLNRSVVALLIPGRSSTRRRGGFRASSRMSRVHQSGHGDGGGWTRDFGPGRPSLNHTG
ncbi:MAG: hypothetical protein ACXWPK_09275, partial [Isosphaeraceae bacterium]